MAIYHFNAKTYSRGKGDSALKVMAKRSRSKLKDHRLGIIYDQSKSRGNLIHAEIMLPDKAPCWMKDREKLWNAVESAEKRKDSQLIREIGLALPLELKLNQNISLMRSYCKEAFVKKGMVADFFIYDSDKNPFSYVMLTTRILRTCSYSF